MFVDAAWGNSTQRRSCCGYIIKFKGRILHYKAKQQSAVALSSTEAEYLALSMGLKDLSWIQSY